MHDGDGLDERLAGSNVDTAVARFNQERYEESNQLLVELVHLGLNTSFVSFCIGRNYLYLDNLQEAAQWFERSLSFQPPFRWTYYELARMAENAGDLSAASRSIAKFLSSAHADLSELELNPTHTTTILRIAHRCFEIDRASALDLYACIQAAGVKDYLAALRIIENMVDAAEIEAARSAMDALAAAHPLDPWGLFVRSRIQYASGERAAAAATVMKAARAEPNNSAVATAAGHRLLELQAYAEAGEHYESTLQPMVGQGGQLDHEIECVKFRLDVLTRDHASVLAFCRRTGFLARAPSWLVAEALFKFSLPPEQISQLDIEVTSALAAFLENRQPYELHVVINLHQFYSSHRMWSRVVTLEEKIADDPIYNHHEVKLRRFETLCSTSRMDEARQFYHEHYANANLTQWEGCVVLRFLAEAKMWDDVGDVLEKFILNKCCFPGGDYFLLRICRRARAHRRIMAALKAVGTDGVPDQFATLDQLLRDDMVINSAAPRAPDENDNAPDTKTLAVSRNNRVLHKVRRSSQQSGTVAFLCADKAYFMSVLTFLASFAAQSTGGEQISWYVFLAQDVPQSWQSVLVRFAVKIGLPLKAVREDQFVRSDAIHVENYGMFTGGNTLSRAAYLRIYAAKYLVGTGAFTRAYYIDSDIICQQDFASFGDLEFEEALLMARAEEASPDVQSVTEKHGLAIMSYFNSGVLALNLGNPDIMPCIDHAIWLSEHESHRLVFHDQCALNIAFIGKVKYLAPDFNFYLRPHRADNGEVSSAILLHFLDRPKPWDLSYAREYRALWLPHAAMVRALLSYESYTAIVAAANQ